MTLAVVFVVFTIASPRKTEQNEPSNISPSLRTAIMKIAGHEICDEKLEALALDSKNVLVTARAGSGKTMTLALKLALRVRQGVKADHLLALSFNRKAANELQIRLQRYKAGDISSATFHSLAYQIVKPHPSSLIFGDKQQAIIQALSGNNSNMDDLNSLLAFFSRIKHEDLSLDGLYAKAKRLDSKAVYAVSLYEQYTEHLKKHKLIDFDDLLDLATQCLRAMQKLPIITLNGRKCDLGALKLVCLDEFQDHSRFFFNLISAIRDTNSSLGIYVVGDDWQAINSFAGSDLRFFHDFRSYFGESAQTTLLNNYRSGKYIVEYGNRLMKGLGKGGIAINKGGNVEHVQIDNTLGGVYVRDELKSLIQRLSGSPLVLSRRNRLYGMDLREWQKWIPSAWFSTIHKAKGSEADTVIYVKEACQNAFETHLSLLSGQKLVEMEAEERRIEYVALSRAKRHLVVIN